MASLRRCAPLAGAMLLFALCAVPAFAAPPHYTLAWSSGYENGFPGLPDEWDPYNNGSWSPGGAMPAGRVSAWTIVSSASGEPVYHGTHAFRGWIVAPASDNHRAYAGIEPGEPKDVPPIPTPLVNSFMVYLDTDYASLSSTDWISLGTWSDSVAWNPHTLSVRDRKLRMAHTDPFEGEYIGPLPRPDFPLRRWVRLTVYIEYNGTSGYVQVWQDGVPMLRGNYLLNDGTTLLRAHWGLYASPTVSSAILYEDENKIWTLDRKLTDFVKEPLPPRASCGIGAELTVVFAAFERLRRRRRTPLGEAPNG